jgi:hypothetical protein
MAIRINRKATKARQEESRFKGRCFFAVFIPAILFACYCLVTNTLVLQQYGLGIRRSGVVAPTTTTTTTTNMFHSPLVARDTTQDHTDDTAHGYKTNATTAAAAAASSDTKRKTPVVVPTIEKKGATAASPLVADLVIWVHEGVNVDENIVVSERNQVQELDAVVDIELRRCTTTPHSAAAAAAAAATGNDTHPECPQPQHQTKNNTIHRTDEFLIFCYRQDRKGGGECLRNVDIAAITVPASGKTVTYDRIIGIVEFLACPEKCNPHDGQKNTKYPYKFDRGDRLCKSTDPAALPPKRLFGGSCDCGSTCFTPEAGDPNSSWPFQSKEERKSYYGLPTQKAIPKEMKEWTQRRATQKYEMRFLCKKKDEEPAIIDHLPVEAIGAFEHHLFFVPEAKLIFCGVPKAGITEWIKFFRFSWGARDYLSFPHQKKDLGSFMMNRLSVEKAKELLSDPTWTKAMFIRDPAERLLSAYNDKLTTTAIGETWFHVKNGTDGHFKEINGVERYVMSFRQFVELVALNNTDMADPRGLHGRTDPHWRPQTMMCGMDYMLPHLDFIGSFEHVGEHTRMLLEKVGLWEEYGAKFDPADDVDMGENMCIMPSPPRPANFTPRGFNQKGPSGTTSHRTGSKNKMEQFYTPELLEKVRKAYAHDFSIWDDLKGRDADDILSGSDLTIVKAHCEG